MKIVVAMDSFKGGLPAAEVCRHVASGLHEVMASVRVVVKPMADGGEGTAAALLSARPGGEWKAMEVAGPLPGISVSAGYAWFGDERTAVVEMAAANGLPLLAEHLRNPLKTSTYGTGQLIKAAAAGGARRILLALGGSATVDGGVGAATALGWRFLDAGGQPVELGGGHLRDIARIVPPAGGIMVAGDSSVRIEALCDVTNPLLGPGGAAVVFGPQKGATNGMVDIIEEGLAHLADLARKQIGFDMAALRGGGAAGGLGAGAAAFFDAVLTPGIETIMETAGLPEALRGARWCITGEGSFDIQSLHGKVVSGVARAAQAAGVPVVVFAGNVKASPADYRKYGISAALETHAPDMPMAEVIKHEPGLLRGTAAQWLSSQRAGNQNETGD